MDGTLVDSAEVVEAMWTEFAQIHGHDASEVIEFAHGRPSRDTIGRYAPHAIDEWVERTTHSERTRFTAVREIPGAAAFVNSLPRGRWALVTSALHQPARERLRVIGIEPPEIVVSAEDVSVGKPDPEGYLAAASALGFAPHECVVFEDVDAGIRAGLAAGCTVVAVGPTGGLGEPVAGRITDFSNLTAQVTDAGILIRGIGA